jgi:nucleoside-diphosphate-sugar epimerase
MSKSVIIVAGGGFLGKSLIKELKNVGYENIAFIDLVNSKIDGIKFYDLDLLNTSDDEIFNIIKNYDIVINCLGQVTNPINLCFNLNTNGIKKVVDAVYKANNFLVHFSTVTIYGSNTNVDEESKINPETSYSCCKAFAEFLIESKLNKDKYLIARLSNLYGEEQPKGVFSYLKRSYDSDQLLEFNNNGEMLRYYLHVKDCASIVVKLLRSDAVGKYNLIGADKFTIKELIKKAEEILKIKFHTCFAPIVAPDNTFNISDDKIKQEIDLIYRHSIMESFKIFFNRPD